MTDPDRHRRRSPSYRASGERRSDEPTGYDRRHSGQSWEQARDEALTRADGRCQDCGSESDTLHVHHETPVTEFGHPEQAHRADNVVAVCPSCHKRREN